MTGVFIANRGDQNYRNITELSIRVGFTSAKGGIGNPTCGGQSHVFHRGAARMVPCVPEVAGRFVTIFVLELNSSLSLCEVEVEVSDIGRMPYLRKRGRIVYVFVYVWAMWLIPRVGQISMVIPVRLFLDC